MISKLTKALLFLSLFHYSISQNLIITHPEDLAKKFNNSTIKSVGSPIGFKPRAGTLHGKLALAQPLNACKQLPPIPISQDEDIFIMADDTGCLESVKAHNIADSGAYLGIIKRNINNTLHDREVDIVHIPILEIEPSDYMILQQYLKSNANATISLLADFTSVTDHTQISMQLWLSPTQSKAYKYILDFKNFLKNQQNQIGFYPRFVLHSQSIRKQYIGCLSSGRFCPPQLEMEGKPEGAKVVGEALRQIIIADRGSHKWFDYASNFYQKCLKNESEFLWNQKNSQLCSQNSMLSSGLEPSQIFNAFNKSFQGPRPQIDSNTYLEEQRQLYIQQQITTFPILFINGKKYKLPQNPQQMMIRVCTMIHPDPQKQTLECQKLTNPPFFTNGEIFVGVGLLIGIMVIIMFGCKLIIKNKMKKEMKGEVDKTLSQYYRYMESLEEPDQSAIPVQARADKDNENDVELTEYK